MNIFRVWMRRLGDDCRVRVDGMQNARWLLNRLSQSFVFKSSEPLDDDMATACSTFHVQHSSQTSGPKFAKLHSAIPEVNLILEPV